MKKVFLKLNNPLLRKPAQKILPAQLFSPELKKVIQTMLIIAYGEQKEKNKPIMVGLAAPQIGVPKRIILVDTKADGKGSTGDLRVYLNPEITWKSKRAKEWYEGCYSTGKICGIVSRPISIKIQCLKLHSRSEFEYTLLEWTFIEEKHTGYIARIFQHEIDHLNGKLFIDLIKDPDKIHLVKKSEFPLYRNKQAWKNWPKKTPLPLA